MAEYTVKQAHWGDKEGERYRFAKGEIREAEPEEVATRVHFGHLKLRLPQLDHDFSGRAGGSKSKKPAEAIPADDAPAGTGGDSGETAAPDA